MNIQDEVAKIHAKFGTSEMANYHIQLLFDKYMDEYKHKVIKATYYFDYISKTKVNEDGFLVGEMETEGVEAYDEEHATLIFKSIHPDKQFDEPYC